jgi:glycosyltransferase involved in cell wall biosynthesis
LLAAPEPQAFAEGICRLLRDDGLRERLAAQGAGKVRERYNFGEFKRRLAACYEGIPGSGPEAGFPAGNEAGGSRKG